MAALHGLHRGRCPPALGRTGIWLGVGMELFPVDQLEALSRDLEAWGEVEVC